LSGNATDQELARHCPAECSLFVGNIRAGGQRTWLREAVDYGPAGIEDLVAKSLVGGLERDIFRLKSRAIPKETFGTHRQPLCFVHVSFKYFRQIHFVGRKPKQLAAHLSTTLWKPYLIADDRSGRGYYLSGRSVTFARVPHFSASTDLFQSTFLKVVTVAIPTQSDSIFLILTAVGDSGVWTPVLVRVNSDPFLARCQLVEHNRHA
jgi:hypothetical protein